MYARCIDHLDYVPNLPADLRTTVNDWLTLPFTRGMRNRHVRTVNWLVLNGLQSGIVDWELFTNSGVKLGAEITTEYNILCTLPGYEISFNYQHGQRNMTYKLAMIPRCINGDRVGVDEPFLLLLLTNSANEKRPHTPIRFSDFSPAMPYWGIFYTILHDEERIKRISAKIEHDHEMIVRQLMRQKQLPFQLLVRFVM